MTSVHPLGVAALMLAGALLSACGTATPTQAATAVDPAPSATGRSTDPADTGGDHSGQQAGPQYGRQAGSQSGRQPNGAAVPGSPRTSGSAVDVIEITKCYTNATASRGGQLLIKARSSDPAARLRAYRPDGALIGEIQNGGSNRYGGTVIAYQPNDPGTVTIRSSAGGTSTAPTTPFQANN